jgi:hypothetical protein
MLKTKLWCADELCRTHLTRFDFSCLACRLRRRWYGKYKIPPYYIKYTYRYLPPLTLIGDAYQNPDGSIIRAVHGKIKVTRLVYVLIDPGRFLQLRCSTIIVLDHIMGFFKRGKPFIEFAEFIANYPR